MAAYLFARGAERPCADGFRFTPADKQTILEPVANLIAEARPLVRNRLFSSYQIHNSSLHCFSYADALHERQRAWRGTEMNKHFREDLPWLGSSCSLLACANPPGR